MVINFFVFAILGPLLLFVMVFSDVVYLTIHCYSHEGNFRFSESTKEPLNRKVFQKLNKYITNVKKSFPLLPWEKLRKYMYDLCSIKKDPSNNSEKSMSSYGSFNIQENSNRKMNNYRNFRVISRLVKNISVINEEGDKLIDINVLHLLLENYQFLSKAHRMQAILLNKRMDEIIKLNQTAFKKSTSRSLLKRMPSLLGENSKISQSEQTEEIIYMKLFLTYNLDRYTNAIISFKQHVNSHWLAKNTIITASEAQVVKTLILPKSRKERKPMARKATHHSLESSSREDSIIFYRQEAKLPQPSLAQDLNNIVRRIESGSSSPANFKQSTIMVSQAQISMHKPSLFGPANDEA